ncbi:MAG: hypothetical protein LBD67_04760 [Candidatus Accumulibacter sp.]|nr:hypothetical protein [Accumulibacter sp.]
MLSLSKYERTLPLSSPYPSTSFLRQAQDGAGRTDWKGVLRHASFVKLRTDKMNGKKEEHPLSSQDRAERDRESIKIA